MGTKVRYTQLPGDEVTTNKTGPNNPMKFAATRTISVKLCTVISVISLTAIVVSTTIASVFMNREENRHEGWTSCGRSPAEARNRGCFFDIMNSAWTPANCYDHELTEMFLENAKFRYWTTKDETRLEIPEDEVRLGEYLTIHTHDKYHVLHCQFIWMKQVRALRAEQPFDSESIRIEHAEHCSDFMTSANWSSVWETGTYYETRTAITASYVGCGKGTMIPEDATTYRPVKYSS